MKNLKYTLLFGLFVIGFLACKKDASQSYKSIDLLKYDIPVSIMAPDSTKITASELFDRKDVTLNGGEDYGMQIFGEDNAETPVESLANQKELVEEGAYFHGFVQEDADGFIYKITIDSTFTTYGFRHVKKVGTKSLLFSQPLFGKYTEEQARKLYGYAQQAK